MQIIFKTIISSRRNEKNNFLVQKFYFILRMKYTIYIVYFFCMKHMNTKNIISGIRVLGVTLILGIFFCLSINAYVLGISNASIYDKYTIPTWYQVGLVFWASVRPNKEPSEILKDRLDTAAYAYENGLIEQIIVSGDNRTEHYNEPIAMKNYLMKKGIKKSDIYVDYAWFDTYDSIYRARDIFQVEKLLLFSQNFHLQRAVYIGNGLWIDTKWISTRLQVNQYKQREFFGRIKAFLDVEVFRSKPKYLWDPIPIISNEEIEKGKQDLFNKENNE